MWHCGVRLRLCLITLMQLICKAGADSTEESKHERSIRAAGLSLVAPGPPPCLPHPSSQPWLKDSALVSAGGCLGFLVTASPSFRAAPVALDAAAAHSSRSLAPRRPRRQRRTKGDLRFLSPGPHQQTRRWPAHSRCSVNTNERGVCVGGSAASHG